MRAQLEHMMLRVVFGMKGGGVDLVAARLVKCMNALAFGMKLGRVPFVAAHFIQRLLCWRGFVVGSGIH